MYSSTANQPVDHSYHYAVPSDSVVVRLSASGQTCRCSRASVCAPRQAYDDAVETGARAQAEEGEPTSDA